ncbi:MAG: hypothetical protein JNL38_24930, partial [Myxococcales bacterium]|nr:hypothetical protein [Myxococcales bacterium]
AAVATALFAATPWSVWLGVSTVPEALTAGLVAAGAPLALADESTRGRRLVGAACILLATLSRYEAWPVAAAAAGILAFRAATGRARAADVVPAVAAMLAGPVAWMAWNAHAHGGDPLHFVARVTRFRQTSGQASIPFGEKLLVYPRALVIEAPEVALLACSTFGALASGRLRERVAPLAAVMGAVALFLLFGVARDGAPTHHPARALVVLFPLAAIAGTEVAATTIGRAGARAKAALLLAAVIALSIVWPRAWRTPPGTDLANDRSPQVAMGLELRARGGAERYRVTPCAFEHFALIAALGAPERVEVVKPEKTATAPPPSPVDAPCPRLESL